MPTVDLNTGMEVLEDAECWSLLATEEVGRVGVVLADQPEIFPVNYAVDANRVAFRTNPGTKLTGCMRGSVVFEVDHLDRENRSAWSVIVRGRADQVTPYDHPDLQRRVESLSLSTWLPSTKQHLVLITPTIVTGRLIRGDR